MSDKTMNLSRRSFVKAAGASGAAIALSAGVASAAEPAAPADAPAADAVEPASAAGSSSAVPADGTFSGTSAGFGWTGLMTCDVTFKDGAIVDIQVVEESDSATGEWFGSARDLLIPRIIASQSVQVDAIAGATMSSNGIKQCVCGAIMAAGGDQLAEPWCVAPAKSNEVKLLEGYDVVVVGLGGSGILSYCAAAYQGAKVFGMEAAGKVGGDSACTYGPMALNSEYLKALFTNGEDYIDEDAVYSTWLEYVESEEKADVISEAVYNSGSSLDFFNENFGFEFEGRGLLGSFIRPDWDKLWCVYTADEGNTSWNALGPNKTFQFTRALEMANALSPESAYQTELRATELVIEDGAVVGVRAESYDGTVYEVRGKSVVLATGGFLGSKEMMNEYLGSTTCTLGVTLNDGTGIRMGQSAGGATYSMGTLPMIHISQVANVIRDDQLTPDQKAILTALALTTEKTMVTIDGDPWGVPGEDGTAVTDVVYAPGYRYFVLYTQADVDAIKQGGLSEAQSGLTSMFINQGGKLPAAGEPVPDIEDILEVGEAYGDVAYAENASELAKMLAMDESKLLAAVDDPETPLYAVGCHGYAYATVGGLDVDANMNVLREDGTPIENLFAVGQDSEGVCNVDGKPYTPWGGQAQSWTFVSGQIAGTRAAAFAAGGAQ